MNDLLQQIVDKLDKFYDDNKLSEENEDLILSIIYSIKKKCKDNDIDIKSELVLQV